MGPSSHHPSPPSLTILSFYPGSYMYVKSILRQIRLITSIEHLSLQKRARDIDTKLLVAGCWVWTCEGVRCEHILPNGRTQMQGDA